MPANMEDIMPFLFCLSPTIRTFTLEFECGFAVKLEDLDFLLPFLTFISDPPEYAIDPILYLLITSEGDAEEIIHHLRKSARLMMLEELDLTKMYYRIEHASVAALSRLPSLRTLKLELAVRGSATPPFTFASFESLRHLSLDPMPLPTLSTVLATGGLRTTPLRSVDLRCFLNSCLSFTDFQHYLALIRAALPDTLEALRFGLDYNKLAEPPLPLAALFAPFLSLNHLTSFDLSLRWGYIPHVADDDLRALADAWPRLEMLHVWVWEMCYPRSSDARPPTIAGLVDLAEACPRLRRVMLPALDVSMLPETSALPVGGYRVVRFLDMCALVKDEGVAVEDVARILDKLFPCLEAYPCDWEATHPQEKSWAKVQDAMREMQTARRGIGCE
ncbi:hypothetical protein GSI_04842 [Ganoderma sinense ZZ0214-1]|uniref:Uncharacterized protein n=1 Tax=Ganoderma sinense ZZ0214-1 TaxID=1077348 RepID=A0A2G8SGA3_9APHY|nr:hypothetical protein GSI_04842 [Ganoderma sinense ZZ0214-1]